MNKAMSKAELKASGAKVSAGTNDVPAVYDKMYECGLIAGSAKQAKLTAALAFQAAVTSKEIDVSTAELLKAACTLAANRYEEGVVKGGGDKFADIAMSVFRSELARYVAPNFAKHEAAVRKMAEQVPVKSRSRLDTYQTNVAIGRLLAASKGELPALKDVKEKFTVKKPKAADAKAEPVDYVAMLREAAEHVLASVSGKGAKAKRDALSSILDIFA